MKKRQYWTEAGLPTYDGSKRARIGRENRIQKAVNAFKNDRMSLTKAAAQFTVPFLTLQTRVATEERLQDAVKEVQDSDLGIMKTAEKYEVCRIVLSARLDLGGIITRKEKRLRDAVKAVREGRFSQIQAAKIL